MNAQECNMFVHFFPEKITPSMVQKFLLNIPCFMSRQTQHQMQCVPTQCYIIGDIGNMITKQKHGTFHGTFKTEWMQNSAIALKSSNPFPCSAHISFNKFGKNNFMSSTCKPQPCKHSDKQLHETVSTENPLQGCVIFSNKVMTQMLNCSYALETLTPKTMT